LARFFFTPVKIIVNKYIRRHLGEDWSKNKKMLTTTSHSSLFVGLVGLWMAATHVVTIALAALPPGAVEEMLASANEVLLIRVDLVAPVKNANDDNKHNNCRTDFSIGASILSVNRTTRGFLQGDKVQFESYHYFHEKEGCEGFVGPTVPELLEVGWCGYVYLNPSTLDDESAVMALAAYGDSLVGAASESVCTPVATEEGDDTGEGEPESDENAAASTASTTSAAGHPRHGYDKYYWISNLISLLFIFFALFFV
jgi:hypothetical protein